MRKCERCEEEHEGTYGSGRFCSISCANTRVHTQETKNKIQNTQQIYYNKLPKRTKQCEWCEEKFIINTSTKNNKYCSLPCRQESWKMNGSINGRKSALIQGDTRRSKNEKLFADMCENYFENVLTNEPIFNGWDADVIIEDIKVDVMWNGVWHYKKITEKHSVKQVQNRDKIKIKEIKKSGYIPYVIKDMGSYNPDFVKEQFNIFIGDMV